MHAEPEKSLEAAQWPEHARPDLGTATPDVVASQVNVLLTERRRVLAVFRSASALPALRTPARSKEKSTHQGGLGRSSSPLFSAVQASATKRAEVHRRRLQNQTGFIKSLKADLVPFIFIRVLIFVY